MAECRNRAYGQVTYLSVVLLFLGTVNGLAQEQAVGGRVTDSSGEQQLPLHRAIVMAIRSADSLLLGHTRTDSTGRFTLSGLPAEQILVLVSYPGYADFVSEYDLRANPVLELDIDMITRMELLQEVLVTNSWLTRVRGDTTEFKADSFYLPPNATVEELLKRLPGIEVDQSGNIRALGQAVGKILVDGEEFFSDDPTVVTQNLLADAVDKVQVYDKKSDQAEFTGVDDGKRIRTLDVKLKEDRKRGYFGKLEAGTDSRKFWNNNGMINAFQGKRKLALYGIMSNTGRTGLSRVESESAGMISDYSVTTVMTADQFIGEGLPTSWNAGAHYSNRWEELRLGLNSGYQFRKLNSAAMGSTLSN